MTSSIHDQVEGKVHEVKGSVKEKIGEATDNPELQNEGADEKAGGFIQRKIGEIKQVFEK